MPTLELPQQPDLDQLRKQAKDLLRRARAGDSAAVELAAEFHPRRQITALTDAQLVVARRYGFPSWPRLHEHVEAIRRYTRSPHADASGPEDAPDRFLRLACLNYGTDDEVRRAQARALLAERPELAGSNIHTAAAVGDVSAVEQFLGRDRGLVRAEGGPFRWVPLLYASYSRLDSSAPGHSTLEVARLLLDHGADPDAGYLWDGLPSPFTALTGAFGRGEGNAPPHQYRDQLARLLLDRGADPNDSQTMYNLGAGCWPVSDESHLELLFSYGLGRGDGGPWRERIGIAMLSPEELVHEELMYAASQNLPARARLLIEHGVDVHRNSTGHPLYGGATPMELSVALGNEEVVDLLLAAGATPVDNPLALFLGACLHGDTATAQRYLAEDPRLRDRAVQRMPNVLLRAAELGRPDALRTLVAIGLDVNDLSCLGRTPLHVAALNGDAETVQVLLELGADPRSEDRSYRSTPAGWAAHGGHPELAAELTALSS